MFELISTTKSLDDVVLNEKTKETFRFIVKTS